MFRHQIIRIKDADMSWDMVCALILLALSILACGSICCLTICFALSGHWLLTGLMAIVDLGALVLSVINIRDLFSIFFKVKECV